MNDLFLTFDEIGYNVSCYKDNYVMYNDYWSTDDVFSAYNEILKKIGLIQSAMTIGLGSKK